MGAIALNELFEQVGIAERMQQEGRIDESTVSECWNLLQWARAKAKGPGGVKFALNKMRELCGPDSE